MKIFKHRINKISEIPDLQEGWGAELDLRSGDQQLKLIVTHDPWTKGDDFDQWLNVYTKRKNFGPLILNTKEDGLEDQISSLLTKHGITEYFFLDTAFPTLVKWVETKKEKRFALRLSHYEPIEQVRLFIGKASWLWVDCFQGQMVDINWLKELKKSFKICVVSPELQGQDLALIEEHKKALSPFADAVCTKRPDLWS